MKKYITIAALLAAGSAFANAAESGTLTLTGGTTYDAGTTIGAITLNQDMTTGNFSAWQVQAAGATDGVLPNITGGNFYAGDYTLSLWIDTSNLASASGEVLLFVYSGSTSSNAYGYNALVWDATNSCFKMGRGNFTASNMAMAWQDNASSSTVTLGEGNLHNVTIAVNGVLGGQTTTYWVDGVDIGTATAYNGNMNGGGAATVMGYYFNTGVTYGDISLTNEKLTSKDAIIAFAAPVPVPEPSAFGMLAGVGALALVASRRRRR